MRGRWAMVAGGLGAVVGGLGVLLALRAGLPDAAPVPLVDAGTPIQVRGEAAVDAPNIVLVIGCTVRRDQTSVYGGPEGVTPFLAELARDGVLFEDVVTAAPWTRAASVAILTGHHMLEMGMVEPGHGRDERRLPEEAETLAELFRAGGYTTIGLTTNPNLNSVFGFHQGFDVYLQPEKLWREGMDKLGAAVVLPTLRGAVRRAEAEGRPLFVQAMLVDAHAPYDDGHGDFAAEGLPERVAEYRGAVRAFDDAVRQLDRDLRRVGLTPKDTVLVVVNDHGEGLDFPEHHGKAHGRFLFSSTTGGIWVARGGPLSAGHRVRGLASQVDIPPTLLGLAGVEGYDGRGLDLSAHLRGLEARTTRTRAYADTWFMEVNRAAVFTPELACHRDFEPDFELGRGRFREGCYDRAKDRFQERPLPNRELEAALVAWRSEQATRAERRGAAPEAAITQDVIQQLQTLGYFQKNKQ